MNKKSLLSLCLSAGILTGVPAFTIASEAPASGNPPASAVALPIIAGPAVAPAIPDPATATTAAATPDNGIAAVGLNESDGGGPGTSASDSADPGAETDTEPGVSDSDSEAKTDSETVNPVSGTDTAPETADTDSETDTDNELSHETDVATEETATATPEVYDPFAADPFTGTPLLRMKRRLETLATVNGRMQKSADLALAVAAAASEDRYFRRNCEYLTRLIRRAPAPSLASNLIFPEFLGIANELMLESTRAIIGISIEDLQHDPQKRLKMLNDLAALHRLTSQIAQIQRKALQNVIDLTATLTDQASRRAVGAPPADLLKKEISEISQLLDQSAGRWNALLNQHEHHRAHFSGILDYLTSSNDSLPAVRHAAQLNRMLRSLLDFKVVLEDFYGHVSASPARFDARQQALSEKLESLAARSNQFRSRVAAFNGRFPARENDPAATPAFSCADELNEIFSLLEKMRSAKIATGLTQAHTDLQAQTSTVATATASDSEPPEIKTEEPEADEPEIRKTLLEELVTWVDGTPWPIPPDEPGEGAEEKSTEGENTNSGSDNDNGKGNDKETEETGKTDLTTDPASEELN